MNWREFEDMTIVLKISLFFSDEMVVTVETSALSEVVVLSTSFRSVLTK